MPITNTRSLEELPNIYELSQFQFDALYNACNGGSLAFAVLKPSEEDAQPKKAQIADQLRQIEELLELKLIEDISSKFKDTVQLAKTNHKRDIMIVAMTPMGIACFRGQTKRVVN